MNLPTHDTVVCPHCASTSSYRRHTKHQSAAKGVHCPSCRKSFRIHYKRDLVSRVTK